MKRAISLTDDFVPAAIVVPADTVPDDPPAKPTSPHATQGLPPGYRFVEYPKWLYNWDTREAALVGNAMEQVALQQASANAWHDTPGGTGETAPGVERHAWVAVAQGRWECTRCRKAVWTNSISAAFNNEYCTPARSQR